MKTSRLGCLTGTGLFAALVTLLIVAGAAFARGGVLFSPGELNAQNGEATLGGVRSHAETTGRCSACHTAFWERERMADRCLDCHTDLLASPQAFHSVMIAESGKNSCHTCHTDHNGPDAAMTILSLQGFPHDQLGFALETHRQRADGSDFACSDCHGDQFASLDRLVCADCHSSLGPEFMNAHLVAFGADCLACHDGLDTLAGAFDHARTDFPLLGEHASTDCAACHAEARALVDFESAPQDCFDCHAQDDAHDGKFGRSCEGCHTTTSWEGADFDHSQTGFPLTGEHLQAACEDCHEQGAFAGTPQECAACHAEPQFHAGLFSAACADCHTTDVWRPARFEQAHTFPIDHGESGWNDCQVCHPSALQDYTCYGCHEHDPGEVAEEHREEGISDFENCVRCHPTGREEEAEDD